MSIELVNFYLYEVIQHLLNRCRMCVSFKYISSTIYFCFIIKIVSKKDIYLGHETLESFKFAVMTKLILVTIHKLDTHCEHHLD